MLQQERKVSFPVFGYSIYIIYTDNIEQSRKLKCNEIGAMDELMGPYVDGLHSYNNIEPDGFVFFRPDSTMGTITHECFHAIHRLFKWIGAKVENEIMAYHLGYLVDQVVEFKKHVDFTANLKTE